MNKTDGPEISLSQAGTNLIRHSRTCGCYPEYSFAMPYPKCQTAKKLHEQWLHHTTKVKGYNRPWTDF